MGFGFLFGKKARHRAITIKILAQRCLTLFWQFESVFSECLFQLSLKKRSAICLSYVTTYKAENFCEKLPTVFWSFVESEIGQKKWTKFFKKKNSSGENLTLFLIWKCGLSFVAIIIWWNNLTLSNRLFIKTHTNKVCFAIQTKNYSNSADAHAQCSANRRYVEDAMQLSNAHDNV